MSKKTRLELTWIGKDERPKLEPRILIEDAEVSYHADARRSEADIFDNILIQGDNLLALKALLSTHADRCKLVYIDPPFNINVATDYYDDGLEHSQWLSLMRARLLLIRELLRDDGFIAVHIDDEEMPYLCVTMDEIFGRTNRVNIIAVKMSEASGVKMSHTEKRLPKLKEYILLYRKSPLARLNDVRASVEKWNEEYKTLLLGVDRADMQRLKGLIAKENPTSDEVETCNALLKSAHTISLSEHFKREEIPAQERDEFRLENAWRIIQAVGSTSVLALAKSQKKRSQEIAAVRSSSGIIYLYKTDVDPNARQPRVQVIFADDNLTRNPGDFWPDIKTTGGVGQEGGVLFPNSKKPETLLHRVISLCSSPGDIVLDSFAGSGTTGAVAHKMGRRWVMIELGEHCHSHVLPRLSAVIAGSDGTGVTDTTGWKGGGGFRFYRLAPSLLEKDRFGNWVIAKEYNAAMLAEAMCKHLGFTYAPSQDPAEYWRHGHSTETDFIYVTTQSLTYDALKKLSEEVGPKRTLLVCCKAFNAKEDSFLNLTVKKIPHAILKKCEWGRDDYSLQIANLPEKEEPSDIAEPVVAGAEKPKRGKAKTTLPLFDEPGSK